MESEQTNQQITPDMESSPVIVEEGGATIATINESTDIATSMHAPRSKEDDTFSFDDLQLVPATYESLMYLRDTGIVLNVFNTTVSFQSRGEQRDIGLLHQMYKYSTIYTTTLAFCARLAHLRDERNINVQDGTFSDAKQGNFIAYDAAYIQKLADHVITTKFVIQNEEKIATHDEGVTDVFCIAAELYSLMIDIHEVDVDDASIDQETRRQYDIAQDFVDRSIGHFKASATRVLDNDIEHESKQRNSDRRARTRMRETRKEEMLRIIDSSEPYLGNTLFTSDVRTLWIHLRALFTGLTLGLTRLNGCWLNPGNIGNPLLNRLRDIAKAFEMAGDIPFDTFHAHADRAKLASERAFIAKQRRDAAKQREAAAEARRARNKSTVKVVPRDKVITREERPEAFAIRPWGDPNKKEAEATPEKTDEDGELTSDELLAQRSALAGPDREEGRRERMGRARARITFAQRRAEETHRQSQVPEHAHQAESTNGSVDDSKSTDDADMVEVARKQRGRGGRAKKGDAEWTKVEKSKPKNKNAQKPIVRW